MQDTYPESYITEYTQYTKIKLSRYNSLSAEPSRSCRCVQFRELRFHEERRREKMLYSGTGPEWYIIEYTLVYEEKSYRCSAGRVIRARLLVCRCAILQEKSFNLKLSGNEVYCTNALLSLIKIMLCRKDHYQKFQNRFDPAVGLRLGPCGGTRGGGVNMLDGRLDRWTPCEMQFVCSGLGNKP